MSERPIPIWFPRSLDLWSLHGAIHSLGLRLYYRAEDGRLEAVPIDPERHGNGHCAKTPRYAGQIKRR